MLFTYYATAQSSSYPSLIQQITEENNRIELKTVYGLEHKNGDRYILKLYSNETFEYLRFHFNNHKAVLDRDAGNYTLKGKRIHLLATESSALINYPKNYKVNDKKRMLMTPGIHTRKCHHYHLHKLRNPIYWNETYVDAQYGTVGNFIRISDEVAVFKTHLQEKDNSTLVIDTMAEEIEPETYEYEPIVLNNNPISKDSLSTLKAVLIV